MDIELWGKNLSNVCMLTTSDVNLWLIGMNVIDKFGSINLNQHRMNEGNKCVNTSSVYIVDSHVINKNEVNMKNVGKIDDKYRDKLVKLIETEDDIFMVKGDSIGCIRNGTHRIRTTDCIPVAQPYRRVVPTQLEGVKSQIDEWLREGIVSRSESEYASPLVVVKKKDGDIRLCVDYRDLNKKTVKDA